MYEDAAIRVDGAERAPIRLDATGPLTPGEALELAEKLRLVAVIAQRLEGAAA